MTRRRSTLSSSQRRHARNTVRLDNSWRVYCRCFICNRESIVNFRSRNPKILQPNRKRGRVLCGKCFWETPDWAEDFIKMYDLLEFMSLKSGKAEKLMKKIRRPDERFYRKKSDAQTAAQDVQV